MRRRRNDGGQAVPLLLVVLGLAVAAALLVADVGVAAARRARAQTAADAAALAGAAAGEAEARRAAGDNGASLESFATDGATVTLTVRLGDPRATASAEAPPIGAVLAPAGGGDRSRLAPALLAALARADALLGRPVPVAHGEGLAFAVAPEMIGAVLGVGSEAGLCRLQPLTHPVDFSTCPPTSPA